MDRKILFMCITVGSTIGGYLPVLVGQGDFSIASLLGGLVGGIAGVFVARRIDASF
jgi:outer membrane lipoprotein SlyB